MPGHSSLIERPDQLFVESNDLRHHECARRCFRSFLNGININGINELNLLKQKLHLQIMLLVNNTIIQYHSFQLPLFHE